MPNVDTTTTVVTLDIQLLDAERKNATTVKLDNPKTNPMVTREQVSAAMQPALTNSWFLTSNGSVAMYLGDVTINTSTKVKLGGDDFYVTPNSITLTLAQAKQSALDNRMITVSGAIIQGYSFKRGTIQNQDATWYEKIYGTILNNGSRFAFKFEDSFTNLTENATFTVSLIIQGVEVEIPVTVTPNN